MFSTLKVLLRVKLGSLTFVSETKGLYLMDNEFIARETEKKCAIRLCFSTVSESVEAQAKSVSMQQKYAQALIPFSLTKISGLK